MCSITIKMKAQKVLRFLIFTVQIRSYLCVKTVLFLAMLMPVGCRVQTYMVKDTDFGDPLTFPIVPP